MRNAVTTLPEREAEDVQCPGKSMRRSCSCQSVEFWFVWVFLGHMQNISHLTNWLASLIVEGSGLFSVADMTD